jgi:hypothetical protein
MQHLNPAERRIDTVDGVPLTARNADLADLAEILRDQHARKVDVVAPASTLRTRNGMLVVRGAEAVIDADGVTEADGIYRPTPVADEGIANRLGIPTAYLRRLREDRPDLYDANVNGWLHGRTKRHADGTVETIAPPESRSFLVRAFRGDGGVGVARAFLSDRYKIVDNFDVLTAALNGIRSSGVEVEVEAADLTDRRMYVRLVAPAVRELAPDILEGYRSPFTGETGADNPVISAGFVLSNSEVGAGAWTLTPRLRIEVCKNGMTINQDAFRHVHLGGKLDEGIVRWSDETMRRNLDLVTSQSRDAVATFLDLDYVRAKIREIRERAGAPVDDAADTIKRVAKSLAFGQEAADEILNHFVRGGQMTAGGVMQAVTSYARTLPDADAAADAEGLALGALVEAARA